MKTVKLLSLSNEELLKVPKHLENNAIDILRARAKILSDMFLNGIDLNEGIQYAELSGKKGYIVRKYLKLNNDLSGLKQLYNNKSIDDRLKSWLEKYND